MNARTAEFRGPTTDRSLGMIKRHHVFCTFGILTGLARCSWKDFMRSGRDFTMIKWTALVWFVFTTSAYTLRAQDGPQEGGRELQVWTGGGHGTSGSQSGDGVFNIGARYGWILTDAHGPGFLRGRFEYAVDVVPLFVVTQSTNTAYGFGVNPFALKWNLPSHRR